MNEFLDQVSQALNQGPEPGEGMPWVEVEPSIIEHYLGKNTSSIESVGYFVFQNVKVYRKDLRVWAQKREKETVEQRYHSGKK